MIDLPARDALRQAVEAFLTDQLTADEMLTRLGRIGAGTLDQTVRYVSDEIADAIDDDTRLVNWDKQTWDAVQRLMLVLAAGCEIRVEHQRIRHPSQRWAIVGLRVFELTYLLRAQLLPLVWITTGVLSIAANLGRAAVSREHTPADPFRAWPFASLGALASARQRAVGFRKIRHRSEVTSRRSLWSQLNPTFELPAEVNWLVGALFCVIAAPLVLLWQCLPVHVTSIVVSDAESCAQRGADRPPS